jgi:hydrogenase/urease accessory protein HupE
MMQLARALRTLVLLLASALAPALLHAHELSMAELDVREVSPGMFVWQWTAGGSRPAADELTPVWPEGCIASPGRLDCGQEGLRGTLQVEGVGKRYSAVMARVHWLDGQSRVFTLTSAQPKVQLYGSAEDRRGMGEIAWAYLVLGVEHILGGIDHLLFVLSLLFLVGFRRQLVWTITAFTAAHSITLVLSVLDLITLRSPPVEATIALSIVLVAGEALHRRQTFARRWPALVAFLFGLVHGLGFAGALKDIGLPDVHLPVALLTFNVGVEVGQLAVVAVAYLAWRALAKLPHLQVARTAALYGIGSVAAFWSVQRILQIVA